MELGAAGADPNCSIGLRFQTPWPLHPQPMRRATRTDSRHSVNGMTDLAVLRPCLPATFARLTTYISCRARSSDGPKPNQRCRRASESSTRCSPVCLALLAFVPAACGSRAATALRSASRAASQHPGPAGNAAESLLDTGPEERALGPLAFQPVRGTANPGLRQGLRSQRSLGSACVQLAPRPLPTQDAPSTLDRAGLLSLKAQPRARPP